jgi:tetratricopeptide (TPR) repeat protein
MQLDLPPPQNWQDFEALCHALWEQEWNCPTIQRNGRSRQRQRGVDIFGRPDGGDKFHGIQCKLKSIESAGRAILTPAEIEREVDEAKEFTPPLEHLIIATTAPSDEKSLTFVRELSERHAQLGLFRVDLLAWPEIKARLLKHETILERFYPVASARLRRIEECLTTLINRLGVPPEPLRAILEKLGEAGVPDDEIPARLDAKANELLELRAHLIRLRYDRPDVAAVREKALALIDRGELDQAQRVLNSGREAARGLREEATRSEAELLAYEAQIDHLQLAYSEAAAKYAKAAALVAPFDRYGEWRFLLHQADALLSRGDEFGDNGALAIAIDIYRHAADLVSRADFPLDWAGTQNNLGNALELLGERKADTARLEAAVVASRNALKEFTRERVPLRWAGAQNNLGNALRALGELKNDTAQLKEAVVAYCEALKELTRDGAPRTTRAGAQLNLSNAFSTISESQTGTSLLKMAVVASRKALKVFTRDGDPLRWAAAQHNLGISLQMLGKRERNTARLKRSVAAYRKALTVRTRERVPIDWAMTQNNLGNAHLVIGLLETGVAEFDGAVAAYEKALTVYTCKHVPLLWAQAQYNLADASYAWDEREGGTARLERAVAAYDQALKVYTPERVPLRSAIITGKQGVALMLLAERLRDSTRAKTAVHQISLAVATLRAAYDMASTAHFEALLGRAVALLT